MLTEYWIMNAFSKLTKFAIIEFRHGFSQLNDIIQNGQWQQNLLPLWDLRIEFNKGTQCHWDHKAEHMLATGIILCIRPANGRWRYSVTPSLIGWGIQRIIPAAMWLQRTSDHPGHWMLYQSCVSVTPEPIQCTTAMEKVRTLPCNYSRMILWWLWQVKPLPTLASSLNRIWMMLL